MSTHRGGYLWRGDPALAELNRQILAARAHPEVPKYGNTGSRAEAPHGTPGAYRRHRRNHERPCEACKAAEALRNALRKERRAREAAA